MTPQDLHTLLARAQSGDPDAVHSLLLHYQPDVTRFARQVCATPEDAEDAVQEALWIASQKLGTLRAASAFVSWLFQIVKHECYRLWRYVRGEQPLDSQRQPEHASSLPFDQVGLAADLVSAIARLPPIYRQVLILRDLQEMTAPEVAALLGISNDAVKSRLHRARVEVRGALQGWRTEE